MDKNERLKKILNDKDKKDDSTGDIFDKIKKLVNNTDNDCLTDNQKSVLKNGDKIRKKIEEYGLLKEIEKVSHILTVPIISKMIDNKEFLPVALSKGLKSAFITLIIVLMSKDMMIIKKSNKKEE